MEKEVLWKKRASLEIPVGGSQVEISRMIGCS